MLTLQLREVKALFNLRYFNQVEAALRAKGV
jgi:hypothetical protein